ncbi:hypothetical protein BD408DRAFT_418295 [Parasitella parasitica]|nr:hypothetical protein BD408DRAFT_418295 [Parasitella parasitica]
MDYNVIHQPNNSSSLLLSSNGNNNMKEPKTILPNKCLNCQDNSSGVSCNNCSSIKKSDICTNVDTTVLLKNNSILEYKTDKQSSDIKAPKRGYKSHVPSACVNCKTAHLACDVSRPCKRCISLKKEDTCQDMQHKKRGRPKLREKRVYSSNEHTYEILYGTIQEPAIMTKNTPRNIIPNQQAPPFHTKAPHSQHHEITLSSPNDVKRSSIISFVHETFESQYEPPTKSIRATSLPISEVYSIASSKDTDSTLDTVAAIPAIQLSSIPLTSQPLLFSHQSGVPSSSFLPIENPSLSPPAIAQHESPNSLTIILSMEVCCARVSDETIKCWGYYPQELAHRSLYDFISPKDSDRLARLHRLLIDNAMNVVKSNQTDDASPLPPTERTTSSLFSNTAQLQLSAIANGSRSFSDTLHIKKRTGEYELYKVIVYIGGGLGADLYDASTLSKQYIVAHFKRHEYEVIVPSPLATAPTVAPQTGITSNDSILLSTDEFASYYNSNSNSNSNSKSSSNSNSIQPIAVFSPMSPLTPTSPTNSSILTFGTNNTLPTTSTTHRNSSSNLDSFKRKSNFNHSKPNPKFAMIYPSSSPKFNIAPTTDTSNSLFHRFQPPSSLSQSSSSTPPLHMQSSSITVTHPTQQYFLQTSSSTLNAAASAAQNKSRSSIPSQETAVAPPDRKMEMSIRSLLC